MRCPNCAGEVPAGSRFCGICGRNVTIAPEPFAQVVGSASGGGQWPAAARREAPAAMSLFELPASRGPRTAKLALVLVLDAILAGAGIVMILSYLDARRAEPAPARKPAAAEVKVGAPKVVVPPAPAAPPEAKEKKEAATRQPKDAPIGGAVADVSGQMSQLVAGRAADLERCYQRTARVYGPQDPLEGKIDLHVTVMPDGSAREVRAGENTTGSRELADCAVSVFRAVSLPAGGAAPVEIVWPLQFRLTDQ